MCFGLVAVDDAVVCTFASLSPRHVVFLDRTHWLQACSIMLRGIISNQTCSKKTAGSESIRLLSFTKYKWWFITEVIIINGYIIIYGILHSIHGFLNVLLTSSNWYWPNGHLIKDAAKHDEDPEASVRGFPSLGGTRPGYVKKAIEAMAQSKSWFFTH
jgi:hypothetical protein